MEVEGEKVQRRSREAEADLHRWPAGGDEGGGGGGGGGVSLFSAQGAAGLADSCTP